MNCVNRPQDETRVRERAGEGGEATRCFWIVNCDSLDVVVAHLDNSSGSPPQEE